MCVQSLSRCRLPPVINHSTLAYVCHYPGADCHQSSTIPPWPMCVTIQGQTATSHQPFHPGLCVSLSRGRLPPVINHSTLAYVCHYPGADCHQSSTIPPWPMCVTIQVQTATSHQPFHPGLCVSLSRGRLPPVINHSTLAYVCHYPGADCHQSSTIPPWPMCVQSLSWGRLPPVINHSTLTYVCTVTIQVQTATSHQPFHPDLCVYSHYHGADCHQSSTIPPWPLSRARLRLTQQSLKRVGHEGETIPKRKDIHLALVGSHCLGWLGGNRCHENRVHHRPTYITCYMWGAFQ